MSHRTSSTRNDYERKINYDWPYKTGSRKMPLSIMYYLRKFGDII